MLGANVDKSADVLPIVDTSLTITNKILVSELFATNPTFSAGAVIAASQALTGTVGSSTISGFLSVAATTGTFTNVGGTLSTAAQPNVTSGSATSFAAGTLTITKPTTVGDVGLFTSGAASSKTAYLAVTTNNVSLMATAAQGGAGIIINPTAGSGTTIYSNSQSVYIQANDTRVETGGALYVSGALTAASLSTGSGAISGGAISGTTGTFTGAGSFIATEALRLTDNTTNATDKLSLIGGRHYTNAQADVVGLYFLNQSSANQIVIGGGHASYNAATRIDFYTAANTTTTTGTQRMSISSAGVITIANLAGVGTRTVVVDANGVLSAP